MDWKEKLDFIKNGLRPANGQTALFMVFLAEEKHSGSSLNIMGTGLFQREMIFTTLKVQPMKRLRNTPNW